jgi:acyl-ACP thioesterase
LTGPGLTELIDRPPEGRVFEQHMRPGFADCAPSGRARLDALARWLQDVAYADVEDAGLAEKAVWVVRRVRLRVGRFPRFGERFELATFCSGLGRMWGERRTTIARAGAARADVEAVALWVHLDPVDWRPVPFTDEEHDLYGSAAAGRRVTARLRHPPPEGSEQRCEWEFRATQLDIAGHINNAAYWEPLEHELLTGPDPDALDAEIEFRTPAQPGVMSWLRDGPRRWLTSGAEVHASLVLADLAGAG